MKSLALAAALAFTTTIAFAQPGAPVAGADPRTEVAAALYAASATQAATERLADARLRQERARIEGIARRARAGEAQARAELASAQERFIADLAARDRAYAQEIAVFRQAVADIAASREGVAALAKFNSGDEIGALGILDRMRAARDAARQVRANVESAAEGRRIASLALEARSRGKLDTRAVITRYEEVTRLDPGVHWDWVELGRLLRVSGRLADARVAANRSLMLSATERDRAVAFIELGDVASLAGDLASAKSAYEEALSIDRKLMLERGMNDLESSRDLSITLSRLAEVLLGQGHALPALTMHREAFELDKRNLQRGPTAQGYLDICTDAYNAADAAVALGNLTSAAEFAGISVTLCGALTTDGYAPAYLPLAYSRWRLGNVLAALGNTQGARLQFDSVRDFARVALASDPSNLELALQAELVSLAYADLALLEGDTLGAQDRLASIELRLSESRFEPLRHAAEVYRWLVRVRIAVLSAGSSERWLPLAAGLSAAEATADLSALDFYFIKQLQMIQ